MIYFKFPEKRIGHVRKVWTVLNYEGVLVRLKKCKFFTKTIDYVDCTIHPRDLEIVPKTTDALRGLQAHTNLTERRSFLGLCNVFKHFIPNFANIASPLNRKLCKEQSSTFELLSIEETNSLNTLKDALILLPILALSNSTGFMTIDTDPCDGKVECVFFCQQPDEKAETIRYWSKSRTNAER